MSLASGDTDKFSSKVGKSSIHHDGPKSQEPFERVRVIFESLTHRLPLGKSTGIIPVPESTGIAVGTTTAGDDETEQNDADDDDHLE